MNRRMARIGALAVLFTAGVLILKNKPARRILGGVNLAMLPAGAACLAASAAQSRTAEALTGSADLRAWAADAFTLWLRWGGAFTASVGGVVLLAALIGHRMRRVRALAGCAGTVLILLTGSAYAVLCSGEAVDPSAWVRLAAAGMACLSTAWSAVDLWRGERRGERCGPFLKKEAAPPKTFK